MALIGVARPLSGLPNEMLFHVLEMLDTEAYIAFVVTHYTFFARRGLAPPMNPERLSNILDESRTAAYFPMKILPPEILLEVMQRMPRRHMMDFVVGNYRHLVNVGIAPRLTDVVMECFLLACPL